MKSGCFGNVEEGVADVKTLLAEYNQIAEKMADRLLGRSAGRDGQAAGAA